MARCPGHPFVIRRDGRPVGLSSGISARAGQCGNEHSDQQHAHSGVYDREDQSNGPDHAAIAEPFGTAGLHQRDDAEYQSKKDVIYIGTNIRWKKAATARIMLITAGLLPGIFWPSAIKVTPQKVEAVINRRSAQCCTLSRVCAIIFPKTGPMYFACAVTSSWS